MSNLNILGSKVAQPKHPEEAILERIPNSYSAHPYLVELLCLEFTCLCPVTGQPDFGQLTIRYVPDKWLIESKALKLYLGAFRNEGSFHETVVNRICHDLVKALAPRSIEVHGDFAARGGIKIVPRVRWPEPFVL